MARETESADDTRVLVCGQRTPLTSALEEMRIPFWIWHDRRVKRAGAARSVFVAPFARTRNAVRRTLSGFVGLPPITHVIAGTEASVVTASLARRALDARRSPHTVALRCQDKLLMKTRLQALGVPMTDFLDGGMAARQPWQIGKLGSPVVVKDRTQSGGRGIEVVENPPQQDVRLRGRLLERFVDAPEVSVESFISDGNIVFVNITEYLRKRHVNVVPASLPDSDKRRLLELNRRVIAGLRIRWGLTHMEFFMTPAGPLFGELALRPPGGYIMSLISEAYGFDSWKAFVSVETQRPWSFSQSARCHSAALLVHPGHGRVSRVRGLEAVGEREEVFEVRVRVRAGDKLGARLGVGSEAAHALIRADNREQLLSVLALVESNLIVELERLH